MLVKGQVVFSKRGRDKNGVFIVMHTDAEYAYISDGRLRGIEKPKKKKHKHLQPTKYICRDINEKLENKIHLLNSDIRKALAIYEETSCE